MANTPEKKSFTEQKMNAGMLMILLNQWVASIQWDYQLYIIWSNVSMFIWLFQLFETFKI